MSRGCAIYLSYQNSQGMHLRLQPAQQACLHTITLIDIILNPSSIRYVYLRLYLCPLLYTHMFSGYKRFMFRIKCFLQVSSLKLLFCSHLHAVNIIFFFTTNTLLHSWINRWILQGVDDMGLYVQTELLEVIHCCCIYIERNNFNMNDCL